MRPFGWLAAAAVALAPLAAAPAGEVYPSVRAEPTPAPTAAVRGERAVDPTLGPPEAPGRPVRRDEAGPVRDRATLRGEAGEATGTADAGRAGRGVARSPAGEAVGSVAPNRSGGAVVRGPDGSVEGFVASPVRPGGTGEPPRRR